MSQAEAGNEASTHGDATKAWNPPQSRRKFQVAKARRFEPTLSNQPKAASATAASQYFKVLYTKRAANKKRKNKSFVDGVLEVKENDNCLLYTEDGKVASRSKVKGCWDMPDGAEIVVGMWEVEVDGSLPPESFSSGECFIKGPSGLSPGDSTAPKAKLKEAGFRQPLRPKLGGALKLQAKPHWLHNPEAPDALVLNAREKEAVPVVVDPYICRHLRPHQRTGVLFLYECIMGLRSSAFCGAVLADEMGLGKTLQVIAVLWTLLKQGPKGKPAAKKCIVVTPSSLTKNWAAEFQKWLGIERLQVMVLMAGPDAKSQVVDFKFGALHKVLIASYETLRSHTSDLAGFCDILVCDEGHRLKATGGSKTMDALLALNCRRRILLSGTPLQNNLDEFYALMSFVNPDVLGSLASFKTVFAGPINRSQDRNATPEEVRLGQHRSEELSRRTDACLLRRTNQLLSEFLPPLSSLVVFCRPSEQQVKLYQAVLKSKLVRSLLSSTGGLEALPAITLLRKLCNHPCLLASEFPDGSSNSLEDLPQADRHLTSSTSPQFSGKMACLESLMQAVLEPTEERMVVVCSSVKALDVIQAMCQANSWATVRIDGSTASEQRQALVTNFNRHNIGRVCLLSTRAGGAGLNLIGANRLVLYDSDWNPAVDLQAMARIWRDGQTKPCIVYRMLTTGTIEEKIWQRQLMKGQLVGVMNFKAESQGVSFSRDELRELFQLDLNTVCNTADLLGTASGLVDVSSSLDDAPLRSVVGDGKGKISFVALSSQGAQGQEVSPVADKDRDNGDKCPLS